MSRNLGTVALEWAVYQAILATNPTLYKDNRGRPVIELPNPDATWEPYAVQSPRTYAWIQNFYVSRLRGVMVLTRAEIERVALLMAGEAYMNAPPPLVLPFDPTTLYEPLLQCVVEFMLHALREDQKNRFEDNATVLRDELLKSAVRLGLPCRVIPSAAWLGRRLRDLVTPLDDCGIKVKFYLTDLKRFTVLEWKAGALPVLDGRDVGMPPAVSPAVIPNPSVNKGLRATDGNDGNPQEPDWDLLERKGESKA